MTVRTTELVPVRLDCGCVVQPQHEDGREGHVRTGTLVVCSDHGLRHSLDLVEEHRRFTFTSHRVDPPDPAPDDPEEVTADGVG